VKSILIAIRAQLKTDFQTTLPYAVLLWIALLIAINYSLDLEDGIIDRFPTLAMRWTGMFLLQGIPYLGVCVLLYLYGLDRNWQLSRIFWIYFLLGFVILAMDRSASISNIALRLFNESDYYFLSKVLNKGKGIFTVIVPLIIVSWLFEDKLSRSRFGISGGHFTARPYLIMLAITAIFIFAAGFFSDIQAHYPRYLNSHGPEFAFQHHWHPIEALLLYEIPYGFDFISTEYFFRGFLVIGMARIFGPKAVLPMVATYAALHFGKPLTETISSVFGGYILGVLALHHRNIWGGVIIHVGVAWLMELVGYLHRVF
jgi:hypothetical protein